MCEFINQGVFLVLGAIISGLVGIWVARRTRREESEQSYLIAMRRLRDEARRLSEDRHAADFFYSTLDRVEDSVLRLHVVGPRDRSRRLIALWHEYRGTSRDRLDANNESAIKKMACEAAGEMPPTKPSAILDDYFTRFIKIADEDTHAA